MADPVYRARAEAPTVLPFEPFTALESLFKTVELEVRTKYDVVRVQPGGALKLASTDLGISGLELDLECGPSQLGDAIAENGLGAADVVFAVVASEPKGGHLRQTQVLGRWAPDELTEHLHIQERGADRPAVLQNAHDGYELRFVAAFVGTPSGPLKPRRLGTVLAEATFRVVPIPRSSGMQPRELTPDVRRSESLKAGAWIYVKRTSSLHDTLRLDESLEVYVDPKVLQLAAMQPSSNRPLAESLFAVPALIQLVFHLAADLEADPGFSWDGTGSEALTLVQDTLAQCGEKLASDELVTQLRNNPARIASIVSGFDGQKGRIVKALESDTDEEGTDELPSD